MRRLGLVLHISPLSQNLIIKVERIPKIGETVIDEKLRPIGKVFDIFGPVSSPYAAVKPETRNVDELVGKILYSLPSRRKGEG
ncbi:MAG: Gar1/Naf1 family protein [Candidatus Bathyarchaeia archaeon]